MTKTIDLDWYVEATDLISKLKSKILENYVIERKFPDQKDKVEEKKKLGDEQYNYAKKFHALCEANDKILMSRDFNRHMKFVQSTYYRYRNINDFHSDIINDIPLIEKQLVDLFKKDIVE